MSKKIPIIDQVLKSMTTFGTYVNTNRAFPKELDGLKNSYLRTIYSALDNGEKFMKVSSISGQTISKYHPHGDSSINDVVSELVRAGIFDGVGNHGVTLLMGNSISPAAPRYIEARVNKNYSNVINKLIKYVPKVHSELEGFEEPDYLPVPVPLCLMSCSFGIGYGANSKIPMFTAASMNNARINNDPKLLEAPFGFSIVDCDEGLQSLRDEGIGKLVYRYSVTNTDDGILMKGTPMSPDLKPDLKKLMALRESGKITIDETTDGSGCSLLFNKVKGIKSISYDEIMELVEKASYRRITFRLMVTDKTKAYIIPLKQWLTNVYNNFKEVVGRYKTANLEKLNYDKMVYTVLPDIVAIINKNNEITDDEISKKLKIDISYVRSVLQKPISSLRRINSTSALERIDKDIQEYEAIDLETYYQDTVSLF